MPAGAARAERDEAAWLARVYATPAPVWFTPGGPRPAVASALDLLRSASDRGLDARDAAADTLERDVKDASSPQARAAVDTALTAAMLRFLGDLRFGRVAPRDVEPHYRAPPRDAPFVARLRDAVAEDRLVALADAAEPRLPLYPRLVAALARYRALAASTPSWPVLAAPGGKVVPGDRYADVATLRARLVALGDLAADASNVGGRYAGPVVEAVVRFQARHGLAQDGVLGRATLSALNVPPVARAEQIALAMERLRWLPDPQRGRLIAVNVAAFRLWAFDDEPGRGPPALTMPVIVGRAVRHETPVFLAAMERVEFHPHWNVPHSILRDEYLGRLARDPTLLPREDLEIVPARGGTPSTTVDAAALQGLRDGALRLRQRPGPKNALGAVKFVLPNTMDIYLHGTPARGLFDRPRRDFSHGCIRVRDPAALASFVLGDQPAWTPEAIAAAMAPGTPRTVALTAPIPVVVFYATAAVDGAGRAHFHADVYGHDARLAQALARPRPALPAAHAPGVEVHELRLRVEADAAGAQLQRGVAQVR